MSASLFRLKYTNGLFAGLFWMVLLVCTACSPIQGQQPLPPQVALTGGGGTVPQADAKPSPLRPDRSCSTNADCEVKNVGSCCGYKPSCVNKDAPVDPQAVQAACEKSGMAGICGFRPVSGCTCENGQCTNVQGGLNAGGTAVEQ